MALHAHKLANKNLEKYTCELLCLDLLVIYDTLNIEENLFPLPPQVVETEQNLELQAESSTNIRTYLNKSSYDWKYKPVEGINLVHSRNRIYVPKTLCKRVIKLYHCCIQNQCGDILAQTLTNICRWSGIVDQSHKICRTCKYCQKVKRYNDKYGLLPAC